MGRHDIGLSHPGEGALALDQLCGIPASAPAPNSLPLNWLCPSVVPLASVCPKPRLHKANFGIFNEDKAVHKKSCQNRTLFVAAVASL